MAPTPSSRSAKEQQLTTPSKTPQSKHRLHFSSLRTPNPSSAARENSIPTEHPVEVIGRVRDHPEKKERPASALDVSEDGRSLRVRTDIGYRDFSLDGVSVAEDEDLGGFYKKFVESRIRDVRLGAKCTVMMYGPTGSGKSHTMFGCSKQPGIVYRALRDILGVGEEEKENSDVDDGGFGAGLFVQIAVLEIYNEEIYDLLSGCNGGGGIVGLPKGNTPKVRLEIMGKKAKNASYITGNEAGKISREVAKVEKRRIVKSTNCNERSSRSHCLIILDVPSVGGRLMLVDMAGSENIEQSGQIGFEAKMQTAKINQGNTALKRVVESIANGDSHVPFRDSKLTMLLQDSFEDDKSKILMILCASPDPKEMHKTISTLEYGAKAKCIVRAAHMSTPKDKMDGSSTVILGSRIAAMNQFICKLQMENKLKEKERDEVQKELLKKEDEVADLRAKIKVMEERYTVAKEEEINTKVDERTLLLRLELKKMEEKVLQQQKEVEMLRQQQFDKESFREMVGSRFMKRLSEMAAEEDQGMEKSMDLDMGDMPTIHDVKEVEDVKISPLNSGLSSKGQEDDIVMSSYPQKVCLSTVFEGNEEEEEELDRNEEEEVQKEVVEENRSQNAHILDLIHREIEREHELDSQGYAKESSSSRSARIQNIFRLCGNHREITHQVKSSTPSKEEGAEIQNIFRLCGNHREITHQVKSSTPSKEQGAEIPGNHSTQVVNADNLLVVKPHPKEAAHLQQDLQPEPQQQKSCFPYDDTTVAESPLSALLVRPFSALELSDKQQCLMGTPRLGRGLISSDKENNRPEDAEMVEGLVDIYVKWETSKEASGNLIKRMKVLANATLSDLRKLIETHFSEENAQQPFTFLLLGDPPLVKDKESSVLVSKLPICNNQLTGHLACLRPTKKITQHTDHLPLGPLENRLQVAALNSTEVLSPNVGQNMSYLTGLRV